MPGQLFKDTRMDTACAEGFQSSLSGGSLTDNPDDTLGTPEEFAWDVGFRLQAQDGAAAHADSTEYNVGEVVVEAGNLYMCVRAGTSGTGAEPSGVVEDNIETDGGVRWQWIGAGTEIQLTALGAAPKAGGIPLVIAQQLQGGAQVSA